jgi:DNA-binding transcriptional ArsR family regulator
MLEQPAAIDRVFHALADRTRRELVQRLSRGSASVSELARPLPMTLAAVLQHLQVLEDSGVIATRKVGRVRTCELDPRGLMRAERWIADRRALWEGRLDRLGALLEADPQPEANE